MRIYLTNHAKLRMKERGIDNQLVEKCLEYNQVSRPGEGNKTIYDYTDNTGYKTSVSAVEENGIWVVVSVWRVTI